MEDLGQKSKQLTGQEKKGHISMAYVCGLQAIQPKVSSSEGGLGNPDGATVVRGPA